MSKARDEIMRALEQYMKERDASALRAKKYEVEREHKVGLRDRYLSMIGAREATVAEYAEIAALAIGAGAKISHFSTHSMTQEGWVISNGARINPPELHGALSINLIDPSGNLVATGHNTLLSPKSRSIYMFPDVAQEIVRRKKISMKMLGLKA